MPPSSVRTVFVLAARCGGAHLGSLGVGQLSIQVISTDAVALVVATCGPCRCQAEHGETSFVTHARKPTGSASRACPILLLIVVLLHLSSLCRFANDWITVDTTWRPHALGSFRLRCTGYS